MEGKISESWENRVIIFAKFSREKQSSGCYPANPSGEKGYLHTKFHSKQSGEMGLSFFHTICSMDRDWMLIVVFLITKIFRCTLFICVASISLEASTDGHQGPDRFHSDGFFVRKTNSQRPHLSKISFSCASAEADVRARAR